MDIDLQLLERIAWYLAREAVTTLILSFAGVGSIGLLSLWLVINHEKNLDADRRNEMQDAWNALESSTISLRRAVRSCKLLKIIDRLISWLVKYLRYKRLNWVGATDRLLIQTAGLVAIAAVGKDVWAVIAMVL